MILDVTAGNRVMWRMWGRTKPIEGVVFIDKERDLHFPPDIIADNTHLPIRTDLKIDSIIFDPPWGINLPPWFLNKKPFNNENKWGMSTNYYGDFKSKRELITYIHKAQTEFKNYTERLCFKWGERNISLWKILPFFVKDGWIETHRIKHNRLFHNSFAKNSKSKNQTYWIVFQRTKTIICAEEDQK